MRTRLGLTAMAAMAIALGPGHRPAVAQSIATFSASNIKYTLMRFNVSRGYGSPPTCAPASIDYVFMIYDWTYNGPANQESTSDVPSPVLVSGAGAEYLPDPELTERMLIDMGYPLVKGWLVPGNARFMAAGYVLPRGAIVSGSWSVGAGAPGAALVALPAPEKSVMDC